MNTEPNRCRFCNSAYGSSNDARRHELLAHREEIENMNEATYPCSCGRSFPTEHGRKVHIARASGPQDRHYPGAARDADPEPEASISRIELDQEADGDITGCDDCPEVASLQAATIGVIRTVNERDLRLELIRAYALLVRGELMQHGLDFDGEIAHLTRIIDLAGSVR